MLQIARIACFIAVFALIASIATADEPTASRSTPSSTDSQVPFMGVYVTSLHPALAHHLRESLGRNQGLLVEQVDENSAAGKAGIKEHDILITYDDQKLFSAEQLAKLVHSDQVGREVSIGYLRDGKQSKAQMKLGEMKEHSNQGRMPHFGDLSHQLRGRSRHMAHARQQDAQSDAEWESFDSMTLRKLKDNKFHAEVQYLDKDGKAQKHVFEGTREELRKSIRAEKDMKPIERRHLIRALNLGGNDMEMDMTNWFDPDSSWYEGPTF